MSKTPVFIVDDSSFYVKILSAKLRKIDNVEVHEFDNGEAALSLEGTKPKIIIADFYLNSKNDNAINGVQLISKLRERIPDLACIVFSSRADLTSTSKSDELREIIMNDPKKLVDRFRSGDFFYLMKNNQAPEEVYNLVNTLIQKVIA